MRAPRTAREGGYALLLVVTLFAALTISAGVLAIRASRVMTSSTRRAAHDQALWLARSAALHSPSAAEVDGLQVKVRLEKTASGTMAVAQAVGLRGTATVTAERDRAGAVIRWEERYEGPGPAR